MACVRALILDARDARASLAAVRALARGGWETGVAAPSPTTLASVSRFAKRRHAVPLPEEGLDAFSQALADAIAEGGYELVFASADADMLVLAAHSERIPALVPYPSIGVLRRAMDKVELSAAAERVGLEAPPWATSAAEARERFGAGPAIVKERLHGSVGGDGRPTHVNPLISADEGEIDRRVAEIRTAGAVPMIQPVVSGELMAFTSVVDGQGRLVARVQQVAERTWPDGLGASVRAHTVAVDDRLAERVGALLRELGWHGLSELQFIVPPGGEPQLIDFNGRFYGSLALAVGAGANLPDIWARIATGRPAAGGDARPGVRYQWLEGDLRAAHDPLGSLRYAFGARHSIASVSDPRPAVHEVRRLIAERRGG
jgi:predicted ATP-grasp superfamily ATP-dependent carboligase